ncbi:hypothetical protein BJ972_003278 [Agromyces atrinae]|uniref:Four-helix bundle copper-binding protein n=3 Tax=Agromyces atrinae TaxID=592376 RepID=A0A4Q2M047_9MICO|nr:hypothetical protein [Agromyces atrinae]RXZ85058.1 hypothetical protein ESP50_16930 [Agromyces atrinae]RXZ85861.1 hypothetical protein ESP50_13815 [Agromyces atrinae]
MQMASMMAMLSAMMTQAEACAAECMKYADMHEDCRMCAEVCRQCAMACSEMMASMSDSMA